MIYFELDHFWAVQPERATDGSAGFDLSAAMTTTIEPGEIKLIDTAVKMMIPKGWVGLLRPRSGLALKKRVVAIEGTIDADYRGRVGVMLENRGREPFKVNVRDRIAQIVVVQFLAEGCIGQVHQTARGDKGFGSTGQ